VRRHAIGLALATALSCSVTAPPVAPESPLNLRYRMLSRARSVTPAVATSVYRDVLARSLYARCEMVPTDSEMFDHRARACGAVRAAVLGIARLFLERATTPRFLRPVRFDNRLRWLDLPAAAPCEL
jgi:hypothetical protein